MATNLTNRLLITFSMVIGLWTGVSAQSPPVLTASQTEMGRVAYEKNCSRCHGVTLDGGEFAPPLRGTRFSQRWAGKPVSELFSLVKTSMPPGNTLSVPVYAQIIAYILNVYGVQPGAAPLPVDTAMLSAMVIPGKLTSEKSAPVPGGGLSPGISLPPWPARDNPLDRISPVTDAVLKEPPAGDWLSWRRTQDAIGFSPLNQITSTNVQRMRVAWTLALPAGPNESTPLVRDGVMFVQSYGDHIQALDAATGDELWHYTRQLPDGVATTRHRNIALYEDKVYFATSDVCVIALDAVTGKLVWEQSVGDVRLALAHGGPLVVKGVVMQGLNGTLPGGQYVVGLDAASGRPLWRFNSIAQPGDPNGNSWNDLPREKRTGGSVWTAGSYDADLNLAFFGPSPTYDTGSLRDPVNKLGVTNSALYTNATVALDPKTGRLVWYYQHLPNDQWNFDWAFERQIVELPSAGRKYVITAGKQAIYDALEAKTGQYLFSIDLGLQNLITEIDPKTGAKVIDQRLVPGKRETITVCPHSTGAKSWLPASYSPTTHILYVPLVESCMDMTPVPTGEGAHLSTGVRWTVRPRPDSDGRYGRLQAINLTTRQSVWIKRQRAPQTTGVLATSGGVLFAGALDRWFTAYDADTGATLWKIRLSDVPNSSPISYLAHGKQYVAMVVGAGVGQAATFPPLVPEIRLPAARSSAIWVFELPN